MRNSAIALLFLASTFTVDAAEPAAETATLQPPPPHTIPSGGTSMRRFSIFILLLAVTVAARAASYEARSPQHAIAFEVVPLTGVEMRYDMKITDLATGEVLASPQLRAKRGQSLAEAEIDVRDLHIRIRVGEMLSRLMASVEIEKGGEVIDSIQANWSTGPQKTLVTGDGPFRAGGDVKAPVIVNRVEPIYPEAARKARIMGIVIIEAVIDRNGVVKDASVLKPLPFGMDQAALDAVRQWTFKPGTLNGVPVDVIFNLTINFKLDTPPPPPPPG
jgi:TonB family protein